jgi:hypothetical protein
MKKITILTLAVATMLAPVALAGHRDGNRYPEPRTNRAIVLSEQLIDATQQMRQGLQQRRGHSRKAQSLAFALDQLERETFQLRTAIIRDARFRQIDARLNDVVLAFNQADREMNFVRSGRLHQDFAQIERATRRLVKKVEIATAHRHRRGNDRLNGSIVIGSGRGGRGGGIHGSVVLGDRDDRYRVRVRF